MIEKHALRILAVALVGLLFRVPPAEARGPSRTDPGSRTSKVVRPSKPPHKPRKVHEVKPPKIERRKLFVI